MSDELCPHGKEKMKAIKADLDQLEESLMFFGGYCYNSNLGRKYAEQALHALDRIRRAIQ